MELQSYLIELVVLVSRMSEVDYQNKVLPSLQLYVRYEQKKCKDIQIEDQLFLTIVARKKNSQAS